MSTDSDNGSGAGQPESPTLRVSRTPVQELRRTDANAKAKAFFTTLGGRGARWIGHPDVRGPLAGGNDLDQATQDQLAVALRGRRDVGGEPLIAASDITSASGRDVRGREFVSATFDLPGHVAEQWPDASPERHEQIEADACDAAALVVDKLMDDAPYAAVVGIRERESGPGLAVEVLVVATERDGVLVAPWESEVDTEHRLLSAAAASRGTLVDVTRQPEAAQALDTGPEHEAGAVPTEPSSVRRPLRDSLVDAAPLLGEAGVRYFGSAARRRAAELGGTFEELHRQREGFGEIFEDLDADAVRRLELVNNMRADAEARIAAARPGPELERAERQFFRAGEIEKELFDADVHPTRWREENGENVIAALAIEERLIDLATERYRTRAASEVERQGTYFPDPLAIVERARPADAPHVERRAAILASRIEGMPRDELQARAHTAQEAVRKVDGVRAAELDDVVEVVAYRHESNRVNEERANEQSVEEAAEVQDHAIEEGADLGAAP